MPLGSLLGGFLSMGANQRAGQASQNAGQLAWQNASDEAKRARQAISPWTMGGTAAQDELLQAYGLGHLYNTGDGWGVQQGDRAGDRANALSNFKASPGYQFRLGEGGRALDRGAASRGMVQSGAQARALTDYGQNTASGEWNNYLGGLSGLSGQGATATTASNANSAGLINAGNTLQYQGTQGMGAADVAGANALGAGIKGAQNSLISLAAYGGGGGGFGLPNFGTGSGASGNPYWSMYNPYRPA